GDGDVAEHARPRRQARGAGGGDDGLDVGEGARDEAAQEGGRWRRRRWWRQGGATMRALPQIPEQYQRAAKWVFYPLVALVVFNVSLYFALPRDRIRDQVLAGASDALGMNVTAGDFDLTLFTGPGFSAKDVVLKTKPALPTEKPVRYAF